mgnify:CR=1 FL=1
MRRALVQRQSVSGRQVMNARKAVSDGLRLCVAVAVAVVLETPAAQAQTPA